MKLVVEDFELVRYPTAGGPLENSPLAKRRGEMGLSCGCKNPPSPCCFPASDPPPSRRRR